MSSHEPLAQDALSDISALIAGVRLLAFDFDGVFTDNMVYVSQDGQEMVRCTRADGIGLQKMQRLGIETVVISTEANPVVSARCRKLKIRCLQDIADKRQAMDSLLAEMGWTLDQVAFVGNDINDLPCLTVVALPIVVADSHPDVLSLGKYRTELPGGHGAVREVCDMFERVLLAAKNGGAQGEA